MGAGSKFARWPDYPQTQQAAACAVVRTQQQHITAADGLVLQMVRLQSSRLLSATWDTSSQFGGHSLLCGQRLEIPGTVTYRMTACVKRQMQLLETHCCDHLLNCCLLLHHVLLLPDFPAFFLCVPAAVCSALTTSLTLVPSAPMAMPC